MRGLLGDCPRIILRDACTHVEMLQLMRSSDLNLSDSGGVQEEAPALGIPLLVLRDRTERPEGILSGNTILVGREPESIRATVDRLLSDEEELARMGQPAFPYGDGRAAFRIAAHIADWLSNSDVNSGPTEPLSAPSRQCEPTRPLSRPSGIPRE
jgi:UDP-N-acetylglucosamine 2-epimerase (non-hydrolysing)